MSSKRTVLLLACLTTAWSTAAFAQSYPEFASIREKILANCYECRGASESELRTAVAELDRLVSSGFASREARRLLADSYREIALTYSTRDSAEQTRLLSRHREIYVELLNDYPESLDLLRAYALVADNVDLAKRLIAEATATVAEAKFTAGMLLFSESTEESELAMAHDYLEQALANAVGPAKVAYGRRYADVLEQRGERKRAESVLDAVERYRQETGL